jgi:hypothetical protein
MKSINKSIKNVSSSVLPAVDKGLKTVGATTTTLVKKSAPFIEKGVSDIYGTMSTGFDLGVKGVKGVAKGVKNMSNKSRRSKKGGRRRRTRKH